MIELLVALRVRECVTKREWICDYGKHSPSHFNQLIFVWDSGWCFRKINYALHGDSMRAIAWIQSGMINYSFFEYITSKWLLFPIRWFCNSNSIGTKRNSYSSVSFINTLSCLVLWCNFSLIDNSPPMKGGLPNNWRKNVGNAASEQ